MYTVEVENAPEIKGEGKPRRSTLIGADGVFISRPEGISSLHENFLHGLKLSGDLPFLGHRALDSQGVPGEYVWQTYKEAYERIQNFGAGLRNMGMASGEHIGIYTVNCAEWLIAEQATFMHGLVSVPIYDTLGQEATKHIVHHAELCTIVASLDKAKYLLELMNSSPGVTDAPVLDIKRLIVIADELNEELTAKATTANVQLSTFKQVEKQGAALEIKPEPILAEFDDVATICYTSGTTGLPKGVVLTHANILAEVASFFALIEAKRLYPISNKDCHISYLPLAHVFERLIIHCLIAKGARIGFYQGDTLKLLEDLVELKPTIFASVPRLFNRVYDKVWSGVKTAGFLRSWLFQHAFSVKREALAQGSVTNFIWDRVVFNKIREKLGGRVTFMLSGSAPISPRVMDFLRICFSADVYEGYGQTETTAGLSITSLGDTSSGHVGVPLPCCEVKLVDVPEMDYTSADKPYPRGEVCVKGTQVFSEYYKDPEKTEALDKDGWCHTGDIGMWDEEGRLKIIDRAKNIFKLAQGEYIAAERIENVYQQHELVAQSFIYGESLQSTLVGIIVPEEDALRAFAKACGVKDAKEREYAELCKDAAIREQVLSALTQHGRKAGLRGFECIKNLELESEMFSVENDLLSPTFKLKRNEAKKRFADKLAQLYAEMT